MTGVAEKGRPRPPRGPKRPAAICEEIKDWIVAQRLKPGDPLPQEKALIERFRASKGTMREALRSLEAQGLVTTRTGPRGGIFVAALDETHAMELLGNYFFFRQPSVADIYAVRCQLEPELAASLVGRLAEEDYQRLEETMRVYDHPPETVGEEYRQRMAELDFHAVLAALSPNPVLGFMCGFLQNLLRNLAVCRRIYDRPNPALRESGLSYQTRLIAALRAGDSESVRAIMYQHMLAAWRYMEACEAEVRADFLRVRR
ncbi:FadR/GntR family transcriptional regulator [Chelativorans intermedius]|uniref:FadR/GntR family transcriptional regulator n=1 Tax=Chelativorans intermedius TaxID=515947 RepID=A0ABV6D9V4_9HYPH|nr:FCD domain-containing protein [Chelativorans intermedius]MCT8997860.1 FCD domain-containing protein [Chelativorans intermedius]